MARWVFTSRGSRTRCRRASARLGGSQTFRGIRALVRAFGTPTSEPWVGGRTMPFSCEQLIGTPTEAPLRVPVRALTRSGTGGRAAVPMGRSGVVGRCAFRSRRRWSPGMFGRVFSYWLEPYRSIRTPSGSEGKRATNHGRLGGRGETESGRQARGHHAVSRLSRHGRGMRRAGSASFGARGRTGAIRRRGRGTDEAATERGRAGAGVGRCPRGRRCARPGATPRLRAGGPRRPAASCPGSRGSCVRRRRRPERAASPSSSGTGLAPRGRPSGQQTRPAERSGR